MLSTVFTATQPQNCIRRSCTRTQKLKPIANLQLANQSALARFPKQNPASASFIENTVNQYEGSKVVCRPGQYVQLMCSYVASKSEAQIQNRMQTIKCPVDVFLCGIKIQSPNPKSNANHKVSS